MSTTPSVCRVRTPSRLHLGFMDMHGGLGRCFGSLGVALSSPCLELSLRSSSRLTVTGHGDEAIREHILKAAQDCLRWRSDFGAAQIEVHAAIPQHQGFGSGTQTTLAVCQGLARLNREQLTNRDIMRTTARGRRSGIGVAAFEGGGLIVDGGKGHSESPPPLLARFPVPQAWRVILITDRAGVGTHGTAETDAFESLPTFSSSCAAYLSRVVLMKLLPSVAEQDFSAFADALIRLQDCIGDYFATAQKGRYASAQVGRVLEHLRTCGVKGLGQSSWGPTGFVFAEDVEHAHQLLDLVKQSGADDAAVELTLVKVANSGAEIV